MDDQLTPSKLWKRMTADQRASIARAFWADHDLAADHLEVAVLVAQQKKFRPKTIASLDVDRKARYLAGLLSLPDRLASKVLVAYHLSEQRPMMGAFLDALDIAHENGLIQDETVVPRTEKLGAAVDALVARFPAEQVALYLNTLRCQDPETWRGLGELPQVAG